MRLHDFKLVFYAVGLIGVLLIASPAIASAIHLPGSEKFSELYLLSQDQTVQNYPFNIVTGQTYTIYAGVGNHLGSSTYYMVDVKFCNRTDQMPNEQTGIPSPVQPLYEYQFAIQNGGSWESPFTFSITNVSFNGNESSLVTGLTVNNLMFNVNKPALWDTNSSTFEYTLLFELWIYNAHTNALVFDNRFVDLQLNVTSTSH